MNKFRWLLAAFGVLGALALAGCNGPGDSSFAGTSSSSSSSGTVVPTVTSITLLVSNPNLPSDGSKPVTITAIARNASNQLIAGAGVNFTSSSGAIQAVQTAAGTSGTNKVAAGITDSNGVAQALLSTPRDSTNRTITVTATSGATFATITANVIGTKLSVTGPANLILNAIATYTVSLSDSGSNAIPGIVVTLASAKGNKLSSSTVTTDASGHAIFQLTGTAAGSDTLTATALSLTATQTVTVSSESFAFTAPAANQAVALNVVQPLTVVWTNNGVPQANQTVLFSTTRGLFTGGVVTTTAMTDGTGTATVSISSTTAGPGIVTASATGVTAQLPMTFVATVPAVISLQASPATIAVQGQSTITATVRDAANNLVSGQTVNFELTDITGGHLSVGTAPTDVQGQAQTVYTASTVASASKGVLVTATVQGAPGVAPATVALTVGGQTVFLSLGTGATISENPAKTLFILPYAVQAVDSAGNAVANVPVTLTVHSLPPSNPMGYTPTAPNYYAFSNGYAGYFKGYFTPAGSKWSQVITALCLNEDVNGTGIFDPLEDLNANGVLDPSDVATVAPVPGGTLTTDSTGTVNVNVTYPEDHALWVQVKLTATATVAGTQSTTSQVFVLPMLSTYLQSTTSTPPGYFGPDGHGPYGEGAHCSDPQ